MNAPGGLDAALTTPFVHFTVLYRLRQRATSLTLPHTLSDPCRVGSPSLPWPRPTAESQLSGPSLPTSQRRPSLLSATVHRDRDTTSPLPAAPRPQNRHVARAESAPALRPCFGASAQIMCDPSPSAARWSSSQEAQDRHLSLSSPNADFDVLSTLDKRELSKIVVRDAMYAQLLDLVPSRRHVQTAVWTLSETVLQFDGVVSVDPLYASELEYEVLVASETSDAAHARISQRVKGVITNAAFFAGVLCPYLGEWGCLGDVEVARIDGVDV